jgi:hypothetical protein
MLNGEHTSRALVRPSGGHDGRPLDPSGRSRDLGALALAFEGGGGTKLNAYRMRTATG